MHFSGLILFFFALKAHALPTGGTNVSGITAIVENAVTKTLEITSNQERSHIRFDDYKIRLGEKVHYLQPTANSIIFNEIVGGNVSEIHGNIISNGSIILQNPAGILFSENARIDIAGLLATTAEMNEINDFLQGQNNLKFTQGSTLDQEYFGSIINRGEIIINPNGLGALFIAPNIENQKTIKALGTVVSLASNAYQPQCFVSLSGDGLINFVIKTADIAQFAKKRKNKFAKNLTEEKNTIVNKGNIQAETVLVEVGSAKQVIDAAINLDGYIQANSITLKNGQVLLQGQHLKNMSLTEGSKQKNLKLKECLEKTNQEYKEKQTAKDNLTKTYHEIKKNSGLMLDYLKEADTLAQKAEKENFEALLNLKDKLQKYQQKGVAANPVDISSIQSNLKQIETSVVRARNAIKRAQNNITKANYEAFLAELAKLDPIIKNAEHSLELAQETYKTAQLEHDESATTASNLFSASKKASTVEVSFNQEANSDPSLNATLALIGKGNFALKKASLVQSTDVHTETVDKHPTKFSGKAPAFLTELKRNLPEKIAPAEPLKSESTDAKTSGILPTKEPENIIITNLQNITEAYDKASKAFSDTKHAQKQAEEITQKMLGSKKQHLLLATATKKTDSSSSGGIGGSLLDAIKGFQQKKLKKVTQPTHNQKSFKTPFGNTKLRSREESEKLWHERQSRRKLVAPRRKLQSESLLIKNWLAILSHTEEQHRNEAVSVLNIRNYLYFDKLATDHFLVLDTVSTANIFSIHNTDKISTSPRSKLGSPTSPFSLEKKRKSLNRAETHDKSQPILQAEIESPTSKKISSIIPLHLKQNTMIKPATPESGKKRKEQDIPIENFTGEPLATPWPLQNNFLLSSSSLEAASSLGNKDSVLMSTPLVPTTPKKRKGMNDTSNDFSVQPQSNIKAAPIPFPEINNTLSLKSFPLLLFKGNEFLFFDLTELTRLAAKPPLLEIVDNPLPLTHKNHKVKFLNKKELNEIFHPTHRFSHFWDQPLMYNNHSDEK